MSYDRFCALRAADFGDLLQYPEGRARLNGGHCLNFRSLSNMRVTLYHRTAHVTHYSLHSRLGDSCLGHLSTDRVPQIVKPTFDVRSRAYRFPSRLESGERAKRINWLAPVREWKYVPA